ncbi:MAG: hypothetical protein ACXWC9_06490 [Pseudobdellovibrionaceae bacterium]
MLGLPSRSKLLPLTTVALCELFSDPSGTLIEQFGPVPFFVRSGLGLRWRVSWAKEPAGSVPVHVQLGLLSGHATVTVLDWQVE